MQDAIRLYLNARAATGEYVHPVELLDLAELLDVGASRIPHRVAAERLGCSEASVARARRRYGRTDDPEAPRLAYVPGGQGGGHRPSAVYLVAGVSAGQLALGGADGAGWVDEFDHPSRGRQLAQNLGGSRPIVDRGDAPESEPRPQAAAGAAAGGPEPWTAPSGPKAAPGAARRGAHGLGNGKVARSAGGAADLCGPQGVGVDVEPVDVDGGAWTPEQLDGRQAGGPQGAGEPEAIAPELLAGREALAAVRGIAPELLGGREAAAAAGEAPEVMPAPELLAAAAAAAPELLAAAAELAAAVELRAVAGAELDRAGSARRAPGADVAGVFAGAVDRYQAARAGEDVARQRLAAAVEQLPRPAPGPVDDAARWPEARPVVGVPVELLSELEIQACAAELRAELRGAELLQARPVARIEPIADALAELADRVGCFDRAFRMVRASMVPQRPRQDGKARTMPRYGQFFALDPLRAVRADWWVRGVAGAWNGAARPSHAAGWVPWTRPDSSIPYSYQARWAKRMRGRSPDSAIEIERLAEALDHGDPGVFALAAWQALGSLPRAAWELVEPYGGPDVAVPRWQRAARNGSERAAGLLDQLDRIVRSDVAQDPRWKLARWGRRPPPAEGRRSPVDPRSVEPRHAGAA